MPTGAAAASGASSGAIRAGAAYVEAFLKDNKLIRGLEGVRRRISAFGGFMMGIGGKAAVAGTLLATPLIAAVSHFANTGDQLNKMSQRTGISVETLSELGYAAGQSGSSLEELGIGLKGMAKFTDAVAGGSKEAAETLEAMGISAERFMASSPEERFNLLADGIASIQDESLRSAAAMKVFGKSGDSLLPLFESGTKGIRDLRNEANALGKTVTKEQAEAATRLGDAWDRVKAAVMGAVFVIGGQLAPGLELVFGWLQKGAVAIGDFLKENKALGLILGLTVAGVFALAGAAFALGVAMKVLAAGVGIATLAFKILGIVIGLLTTPIGLAVGAIAGLGVLFLTQTKEGKKFAANVGANFMQIADTAKFAWGGIAAAIQKGDLELAANIALTTLRLAWAETILWLTERWTWFKKTFRDGWADLGTGIRLIWNDLTSALAKGLAWVLDKALFLFRNTIGLLFDGLAWAAKKLGADDTAKTLAEIGNLRFDSPEVNAEIERDRVAKRNEIVNEAAKAQAERDAFRHKQINEAKADVYAAREELNRLVAEAKKPIEQAGSQEPKSESMKRLEKLQGLGDAAKGAFSSSNWKGAFALGDKIQQKQLKVQEEIRDGVKGVDKKLGNAQVMRIN